MKKTIACLDAAIDLSKNLGWRCFPVSGKHPFPGTHGHLEATDDRRQLRRWWRQFPEANVAVACSSTFGPITVDIDGAEGIRAIEELGLPPTLEATSGRPNRKHLYFAPSGRQIRRAIKVLPGVDILGDGGYVIAPPSIHVKTGKPYRWLNDLEPIPFPDELFRLLEATRKNKAAPPLPEFIYEGKRDELLTSLAGSMRRRGASEDSILAALREENERKCRPPLPDRQLKKIARSIAQKTPVVVQENLTDLGNARRFISMYSQDVQHVRIWKKSWLIWEGSHWSPDDTGEVDRMAKRTIQEMYREANTIEDEKAREALLRHAMKSETSSRVRSMLDLASTEPEITALADSFDRDPWLLNVDNGTINLKTGEFYKHDREDRITRVANVHYDPRAKAPTWRRFLREITKGDKELIRYLQRAAGYSLTGSVKEQCLFFCFGTGQNGKSTFLETLRELMGPYSQQADFSTFLSKNGDGPRNDLARMKGVRLVTAIEASVHRSFDEGVLKQLTGGDTVTARRLYEEFFEFQPTHKIFLAANHKPHVSDQTDAFWRRIRLIPFTVRIPDNKKDGNLKDKLKVELSGILNWALEGCLQWIDEGLGTPPAVLEATQSYKEEEDLLGEFFAQCCKYDADAWSSTANLYQHFVNWWRDTRGAHNKPPAMRWFTRSLGEKPEVVPSKRRRVRGWRGISVRMNIQ